MMKNIKFYPYALKHKMNLPCKGHKLETESQIPPSRYFNMLLVKNKTYYKLNGNRITLYDNYSTN